MEVTCDGCEGSCIAKLKMCWHDRWQCACPELSVMCEVCGGKGVLKEEDTSDGTFIEQR